jgi:chromosomal replication initiation ATPase DnaA
MSENNPLLRINNAIDSLIAKHGSPKAADLIEALSLESNPQLHSIDLQKYIIAQVVEIHKIQQKNLAVSRTEPYKKARKTCFYLLKVHCNLSAAKIKSKFPKYPYTRNQISADIKKMKNIVDLPAIDKNHHTIYQQITNNITKFKQQ